MLRFLMQKLLHKKWMVVCLLIGNILLVAIAVSNPMYKNASLQRTLTKSFDDHIKNEGNYPGVFAIESSMTRDQDNEHNYLTMEELSQNVADKLKFTQTDSVQLLQTMKTNANSKMMREDNNRGHTMRIASLTGIGEHIKLLAGRMYADEKTDGVYEAIVSQKAYTNANLILDEELEFTEQTGKDGKPIVVKIVGVYTNSETEDSYWVNSPSDYSEEVFISSELFKKDFINTQKQVYNIESFWYIFFDYTKVEPGNVPHIVRWTDKYMDAYSIKTARFEEPAYYSIMKEFLISQSKITTTLLILQVPVLVLLLAFIFMISRQMLDLEQNEMALLKSRGVSKKQIIELYALQSVIIAGISMVVGVFLGAFLCTVLGSANGFLEFVHRSSLKITVDYQVIIYLLVAGIVSVLVMVLPVFKDAGVSIVNYKQSKNKSKKPLWSRVYLDVILFLVSIYGLYSFSDRKETLMMRMISGESVDPMLFLCASLFIISAGLVALRIQPILVKLVYAVTKKVLPPAGFASFLHIIRNKGKQRFMMVFLMLTVALGIYNTTVARTILSNAEKNIEYDNGADIRLKEVWKDNSAFINSMAEHGGAEDVELTYVEPDYTRFESLEGTKSVTKVLRVSVGTSTEKLGQDTLDATLLGIDTKKFGETINFRNGLLPEHINTYLNVLGTNKEALLLSMNYHDLYGYKVGDKFTYSNEEGIRIEGVIYGFVNYFPGYNPKSYSISEDGGMVKKDEFLVVANLVKLQEVYGITPYELWIKTNGSSQYLYDYIEANDVQFTEFSDVFSRNVEIRNDALFQGTNGILTMSFIVVLILCSVGFLIYWILSIRQRELLFGVFRAMGMRKNEILFMLINEQIFSTGVSVGIGAVIGLVASAFFVPLVQIFYSTTDQVVPLMVVNEGMDMVRLFGVIGFVIFVCMVILGVIISRINISQALKLGED